MGKSKQRIILVPPARCFKFNFKVSTIGNPHLAGIGGIICHCIASQAGCCLVNRAELPVLRMGLRKALHLSLHGIVMECDSLCVIHWASGCCQAPWSILDAAEMLDLPRKLTASFIHVKRAANVVANGLAKKGV